MKFLLIIMLLVFSNLSFGDSAHLCFQTSEDFYQCIENYIETNLPNTQWCSLEPINQKDNSDGLILFTLILDEKKNFKHETYLVHPSVPTRKITSAYGKWSLEKQLVSVNYDYVISEDDQLFPNEIFVDFIGDDGDVLFITNPVESEIFTSVEFVKCNSIAWGGVL